MTAESNVITVQEAGRDVAYRFVASVEELKKTGQLTRWVDDHDILLYEYEGEVKGLSNICRHFGGPVGYHKAKDGVFVCLWHNYEYAAADGSCLTNPKLPLRRYNLRIDGSAILVQLVERE